MATKHGIEKVNEKIASVASAPVEAYLENKPEWGNFNFLEVEQEIRTLYGVIRSLQKLSLLHIPNDYDKIFTQIKDICDLLLRFRSYSQTHSGSGEYDRLISDARSFTEKVYEFFPKHVSILLMIDAGSDSRLQELNRQKLKVDEIATSAKEVFEEKQSEADEIIAAIRASAADQGVSKYTEDFSSEAKKLARNACQWLWATGMLAVFSFLAAVGSWFVPIGNESLEGHQLTVQLLQLTVSKIVSLGILFGTTIWCGKNYRAIKHQQAVNQHRANALKTFQSFVQATSDPATKEAVLMETTRSIFALSTSGYLNNPDAAVNADNLKVVEMIKGISGQSS